MKQIIAVEHEGMLLKHYLQQVLGFSRRIIKVIKFEGGSILVNGQTTDVRVTLSAGDEVEIKFPPEQRGSHMVAEPMDLEILYEDQDVLVLNKPAGIASIPSFNHPAGTIANRLIGHYDKQGLPYTVHIVTRLDKDTSGLMLVAKHRFSHSVLSQSQKRGSISRAYQAIAEGSLESKAGIVDAPIGRKEGSIIERTVREGGQTAVTHYRVIGEKRGYSLIKIKLETGRTHQIRVHFSYLGHPLLGDELYGGSHEWINRQALHCCFLTFPHPVSGEKLAFSCALPADMTRLI